MFGPWLRLSLDATMLAIEAQRVIAMRLTSAALGRGSHAENTRMVTEKAAAFVEAATALAAGGADNSRLEAGGLAAAARHPRPGATAFHHDHTNPIRRRAYALPRLRWPAEDVFSHLLRRHADQPGGDFDLLFDVGRQITGG